MRYLITFLTICFAVIPVVALDYNTVDSISYQYFVNGKWEELIQLEKQAKLEDIRFKRLSQRIGYAYFVKGKYYQSMRNYEQAMLYDNSDEITHLYLYYNGLNTGNLAYARYHASFLSDATKASLKIKSTQLISSIDAEYNYKITNDALRENPEYKRMGIGSMLGYRIYLYQTYSMFEQVSDYTNQIAQNEYFISAGLALSSTSYLQLAYKKVNTSVNNDIDLLKYPGYLLSLHFNKKINRLDLSFSASSYNLEYSQARQYGVHAGLGFTGLIPFYLKSSIYKLNNEGYDMDGYYYYDQGVVFKQSIGALWFKHLWTEAYVNLGKLSNFADYNGLYLYNTLDPTTFRYGFTGYYYLGKHLTLFSNYSYDKKHLETYDYYYNQHSFSGGIIWKL